MCSHLIRGQATWVPCVYYTYIHERKLPVNGLTDVRLKGLGSGTA